MWVSGGFQRDLTLENIKVGFCAIGIWRLDPYKVDWYLGLTRPFSTSSVLGASHAGVGVESASNFACKKAPSATFGRILETPHVWDRRHVRGSGNQATQSGNQMPESKEQFKWT